MKLTDFTFQLMIVGVPGIIAYFLLGRLVGRRRDHEKTLVILQILLLSLISYIAYATFDATRSYFTECSFNSDVLDRTLRDVTKSEFGDVFGATIAAVLLSFAWSYVSRYDLLNRFASRIKASERFGYEDVWDYLNHRHLRTQGNLWVYVRDHKVDQIYYGYISHFSEHGEDRELLIREVDVYKGVDGSHLYTTNSLYISRNRDDISIEEAPSNQGQNGGETQ